MAIKKTKATTKKVAAKKAAKKTATKAAAKKATKKVARKASKKTAKKAAVLEPELNLKTKSAPTVEEIQQAAYLNYIDRVQSGQDGSPEHDWAKAERELA